MALRLKPGRFYETKAGALWCCFLVDENAATHCQAHCIEVATRRTEYFYLDGRYDFRGLREHTLVQEAPSVDRDLLKRLYQMAEPALEGHHCTYGDGNGTCTCDSCELRREVKAAI